MALDAVEVGMMYIAGQDRSQLLVLPEAVDDYVGSDNPVRFIDAFVYQALKQGLQESGAKQSCYAAALQLADNLHPHRIFRDKRCPPIEPQFCQLFLGQ